MKSFFNKLKDGLDSLTGSPEKTLELAREAMKGVNSDIYLAERDGVFKGQRQASDEFKYCVDFTLIPDKKSLTFQAVIKTAPDSEYAERAANYKPEVPVLKAGVKDGLPCLTAVFENNDMKSAEQLTKAIQEVLDCIAPTLEDFATAMRLRILNRTPSLLRTALKGLPGVDYSATTPGIPGGQANGLWVTVKVPEFKSFRLRLGFAEDYVHYVHYLQNVDAELAVKSFKANGLKALALEDGSVKVHGSFSPDSIKTIADLREKLSQAIASITKALKAINAKIPLGDEQLRAKMFDCWEIESMLLDNKYFKNYDQNGTVTLVIPADKSATGKEIQVVVTVEPSEVFAASESNIALTPTGATEKKLTALAKTKEISKIYIKDGRPTVGYYDEAAEYSSTPSGYVGLPWVMDKINTVMDVWPDIMEELGLFTPEKVRTALKSLPGFKKIDEDGDMLFEFPTSDEFTYERFMWVYVKPDYVRFQMGIRGFKTSMKIDEALAAVKSKLPKDVDYAKSDETIRCSVKVLPGETELKEKGRQVADLLLKRSVEVAKLCGMPARCFSPQTIQTLFKNLPGFSKVDEDGDILFNFSATDAFSYDCFMWVYVNSSRIRFEYGIRNFNASMPIDEAFAKVKKTLPKDVDYQKAAKSDSIRMYRTLTPDDLGKGNVNNLAVDASKEIIKRLSALAPDLAKACGMPLFVLNARTLKLAFEATNMTSIETNDNYGEGNSTYYKVVYFVKNNEFMAHVHRKFGERFGLVYEDFEKAAKRLDKRISEIGLVKDGAEYAVEISMPGRAGGYTDRHALSMDIMDFGSLAKKVDDLVRDYDKKAAEQVAEARRREREAEEREAERRRREREKAELDEKLATWHSYPVDGSDTVENLKRWFNKCYPYLRLGIYKLKTGQSADRDGASITQYDDDLTMRQLRSFRGDNEVKIYGRFTPADVEKEFRNKVGLIVKVCYTDGDRNRYYIAKTDSEYKKSLVQLEKEFEEKGYYYNIWH